MRIAHSTPVCKAKFWCDRSSRHCRESCSISPARCDVGRTLPLSVLLVASVVVSGGVQAQVHTPRRQSMPFVIGLALLNAPLAGTPQAPPVSQTFEVATIKLN